MKFWDKVTHFYIKNVKKWMFCPNCDGEGKTESRMHVDWKNNNWVCDTCDYVLPCKLYEADMIFWYCDGCGTYLNYQEGFTELNRRWQCTKCGFDNDVTENIIINVCCRCGKTMPKDYKPLLCSECQQDVAIKVAKVLKLTAELCAQISESLHAIGASRDVDYGNSPNEYAYALQQIYYDSNGETKEKIDKTVRKFTGKTLSEAMDIKFTCANCGNTNVSSLFDEGDTIYCGKCCHRTRKSDGRMT